jgi:signal transduction histidine kinase
LGFIVLAAALVGSSYALVARVTTPQGQQAERGEVLREALQQEGIAIPRDILVREQPRGRVAEALRVIDLEVRQNVLDALLRRSLLVFLIVAAVSVPLAYWLAGRVLRPVDEITRAANALSESTLDRRLRDDGPQDEFGRLRTSFNGMLDRLQNSFDARQRFAADASHELRTPLAVMAASADNVLAAARPPKQARELAETVRDEVSRSESLVSSLLTLARADDVSRTREDVDLADVAAAAVAQASDAATAAGVRLDLEISDTPANGDRVLLERMVANLVDNAIRYNAEADRWVTCRVFVEHEQAVLEVVNPGTTVDPGAIPALFERFNRGAARHESGGHGLGLPIVAKVVAVHGGNVRALARAEGGLTVRVALPLRS